jgi:hypothetical protein
MRERYAARVAGHDAVEFDGQAARVVYRVEGRPIWAARAVLLAKLNCDLHMYGWWWHGRPTWTGSGPFEEIVRAGEIDNVMEFRTDALPVTSEDEAFALAELGGALAGASGVSFTRSGRDLSFWALYDGPDVRASDRPPPPRTTPVSPFHSVRPPPETAGRYSITEPPPPVNSPSQPPPRSQRAPTSDRPPNSGGPTREAWARIADLAMGAAREAYPGVRQAVVVASVDPAGGRRIAVHLVALAMGKLVAVDVPRDLVEALAKIASDAAHAGVPRWKRLAARIADDEHGFSFEIETR